MHKKNKTKDTLMLILLLTLLLLLTTAIITITILISDTRAIEYKTLETTLIN